VPFRQASAKWSRRQRVRKPRVRTLAAAVGISLPTPPSLTPKCYNFPGLGCRTIDGQLATHEK
jgi:hypothetical protein